jgi:hypothetical protein
MIYQYSKIVPFRDLSPQILSYLVVLLHSLMNISSILWVANFNLCVPVYGFDVWFFQTLSSLQMKDKTRQILTAA